MQCFRRKVSVKADYSPELCRAWLKPNPRKATMKSGLLIRACESVGYCSFSTSLKTITINARNHFFLFRQKKPWYPFEITWTKSPSAVVLILRMWIFLRLVGLSGFGD